MELSQTLPEPWFDDFYEHTDTSYTDTVLRDEGLDRFLQRAEPTAMDRISQKLWGQHVYERTRPDRLFLDNPEIKWKGDYTYGNRPDERGHAEGKKLTIDGIEAIALYTVEGNLTRANKSKFNLEQQGLRRVKVAPYLSGKLRLIEVGQQPDYQDPLVQTVDADQTRSESTPPVEQDTRVRTENADKSSSTTVRMHSKIVDSEQRLRYH